VTIYTIYVARAQKNIVYLGVAPRTHIATEVQRQKYVQVVPTVCSKERKQSLSRAKGLLKTRGLQYFDWITVRIALKRIISSDVGRCRVVFLVHSVTVRDKCSSTWILPSLPATHIAHQRPLVIHRFPKLYRRCVSSAISFTVPVSDVFIYSSQL